MRRANKRKSKEVAKLGKLHQSKSKVNGKYKARQLQTEERRKKVRETINIGRREYLTERLAVGTIEGKGWVNKAGKPAAPVEVEAQLEKHQEGIKMVEEWKGFGLKRLLVE